MMDYVITHQLAKARYEEMLEAAAEARRANKFMAHQKGLSIATIFNNIVAELKLRPRSIRRAATRI